MTDPITQPMTYESLRDQTGKAAEVKASERHKKRSTHYYSVEVEVDLLEQDENDLERLLLGQLFDVEEKFHERNDDYLYTMDETEFKDILDEVLEHDMTDVIEEAFEHLGYDDADDLIEALKDDSHLTRSELNIESFHYHEMRYMGEVQAHALLAEFNPGPLTDAFFAGLLELRVPLSQFVAHALPFIKDAAGEENELSDKEVEFWGLDSIDLEDDAYVNLSWPEIYKKVALEAHDQYMLKTGLTVEKFHQPSVISAEKLVDLTNDNGPDVSFYAYFGLGRGAIKDFSAPVARQELNNEIHEFTAILRDGIISCSNQYVSEEAEISAPVEIPVRNISIAKERPETRTENDFSLNEINKPEVVLYDIAVIKRIEHKNRDEPFNFDDPVDQSLAQEIKRDLKDQPLWSCALALEKFSKTRPGITLSMIKDKSPDDQNLLAQQIFKEIEEYPTAKVKVQPGKLSRLESLIDLLDTFDHKSLVGLGFLNMACLKGLPQPIIDKFNKPECVADIPGAQENPLSRTCAALTAALFDGSNTQNNELTNRASPILEVAIKMLREGNFAYPERQCIPTQRSIFHGLMNKGQGNTLELLLQNVQSNQSDEVHRKLVKGCISLSIINGHIGTLPALLNSRNDIDLEPYILQTKSRCEKINSSSFNALRDIGNCKSMESLLRAHQAKSVCLDVMSELGLNFSAKP